MSRRAHIAWLLVVFAAGAVFLLSLGSDVWEAYAAIASVAVATYLIALRKSTKRRPSV